MLTIGINTTLTVVYILVIIYSIILSWNIIEKRLLATWELEPESQVSVDRHAIHSTITHPQMDA